eukprot:TRINITY_DN121831_c0_g1_i1.p1 TRINITY_DN121831_c0_g1~~TRINITY_DN121831_c0_g1_i1.p1  ORF type:complete len:620 (-),score=219.74 TRINITY_DN121831_c0_g1_i1:70-1929(-)
MNKVISGYFDDAHRGLQRANAANVPANGSHVQLPPLRSDSPPGSGPGFGPGGGGGGWDKGGMRKSGSLGAIEFSHEQLDSGVQMDRIQQTMQENGKLMRRSRALQDQLSITAAKKEAFKAQAQRLEKEFKKSRDQSDTLQKELMEARREASQCSQEAQEALQMMTEMRKAHIHEVKLLQRGLAARGNDDKMRNRVNEVADLVDKVGRAVVQRDEAIRDKTKMQTQYGKAVKDLRSLTDECGRLKRQNRQLTADLKEAKRRGAFKAPKPDRPVAKDLDESDEEFEHDLMTFEKRFEILEEGPAGLDILASNLSKDKQMLEKRIRQQQETMNMLNQSIEDWKAVNADKDEQIKELNLKVEQMLQDQALLHEQIAHKRREIELEVEEEKGKLEARIRELQADVDLAQSNAEGLEKVSSRLTQELVKVHGQYGSLDSEPVGGGAGGGSGDVLAKNEQYVAKTGESLSLQVYKMADGTTALRASNLSDGGEAVIPISEELKKELDPDDPWPELFSRVGVSAGPPSQIVVSSLVDRREVQLQPSDAAVILAIYRYDPKRYFFSGVHVDSQKMVDLVIKEEEITPGLQGKLEACSDESQVFNLLTRGLSFQADGTTLAFSASEAES